MANREWERVTRRRHPISYEVEDMGQVEVGDYFRKSKEHLIKVYFEDLDELNGKEVQWLTEKSYRREGEEWEGDTAYMIFTKFNFDYYVEAFLEGDPSIDPRGNQKRLTRGRSRRSSRRTQDTVRPMIASGIEPDDDGIVLGSEIEKRSKRRGRRGRRRDDVYTPDLGDIETAQERGRRLSTHVREPEGIPDFEIRGEDWILDDYGLELPCQDYTTSGKTGLDITGGQGSLTITCGRSRRKHLRREDRCRRSVCRDCPLSKHSFCSKNAEVETVIEPKNSRRRLRSGDRRRRLTSGEKSVAVAKEFKSRGSRRLIKLLKLGCKDASLGGRYGLQHTGGTIRGVTRSTYYCTEERQEHLEQEGRCNGDKCDDCMCYLQHVEVEKKKVSVSVD